ncbi:MAG: hypothetical protein ACXWBO_10570 [Ilumatobacteraceae bacterium]
MSDVDVPELPEEWTAQGWTPEVAYKGDEEHHEAWGESDAIETPADPSSVSGDEA